MRKKIQKKNRRKMQILSILVCVVFVIATFVTLGLTLGLFTSNSDGTITSNGNLSGIYDNQVIVDEQEADWYYYQSLNYTESSSGTLPTGVNQNIYNNNTLVKVKITYSGTAIDDSSLIGYVSLNERQNEYVYYKCYPVVDGYVTIELIDNPFTDRPNNKGFNGWITDYQGASISYDDNYYVRYVKVPVTFTDSKPDDIDITMHASWIDAKVGNITSTSNQWASVFGSLNSKGMQQIGGEVTVYEDVTGYYIMGTINNGENYPSGAVNNRGQNLNNTCRTWGGGTCTYYIHPTGEYQEGVTYYRLNGRNMTEYEVQVIGTETLPGLDAGILIAGYYREVIINGGSYAGYYDRNGIYQSSGTCSGSCTYYELIQYYDDNGNVELSIEDGVYYYLATRDTNIIVMQANTSSSWSSSQNKPFTLTSSYNDVDYSSTVTWNISNTYVKCYNDTAIENITINSNQISNSDSPASSASNTRYFYGNYQNVKIGRGIIQSGNYKTFNGIFGGDNNTGDLGSSSNTIKYKLIVESGFYNTITLTNGPVTSYWGSDGNKYLEAIGVYGNDYDKVNKDNTNLDVYFDTCGSWGGGDYYSTSEQTGNAFDTYVKSGNFGSGKYDYTTGIYVGGRSYGSHYAARRIKVEGGWIYNLIGGPLSASNRSSINDIYMYMTGGEVDVIIGGAGTSATYGNRIIAVTGGRVNYSVFGGSNGYQGADTDGTINGSSFVYIGGNATIGNSEYVTSNSTIWGAEAGSVFGIGNGKEGTSSIGSNDNSNIIIDGNASILNNVYGGGNFGATGISSSSNTNTTHIWIKGGTVNGSVYGGGNNNGAGSSAKISSIYLEMTGGVVNGSVYGGANKLGVVYGSVDMNILGGTVLTSVYGGGEGGYSSESAGTYVTRDVNVTIGNLNDDDDTPVIQNSVYGGSAFGTVNGESNTTAVSSYNTNVVVNSGTIGNVFGGGQGSDTYTPYVLGNVSVDIHGGVIENAYGGNDLAGSPNGSVIVTIDGGQTTSAYAGGNQTSVDSPYIYLLGGTVTNAFGGGNNAGVTTSNVLLDGSVCVNVFGGSNTSGDVSVSNVVSKSGTATTIYGGNNLGGTTGTTNVLISGGDIDTVYGGGERTSVLESTNVTLNAKVSKLFGGSNTSGDIPVSYIGINDGTANEVYGGNNAGGVTTTSNITINGGFIHDVYGGGLKAFTGTSNINLVYGVISNIYGGGSEAGVTDTHINLNKGSVTNVFGGSNKSGEVTNSYIKNVDADLESSQLSASANFTTSTINSSGAVDIASSETINVSISNNTGVDIVTWDYYLIATDAIFDSNWSGTNVVVEDGVIHADEVNQWYGTNPISNGNTHSFSFNIHSKVAYDDFKIIGYIIVGYDSNGNEYKTIGFDSISADTVYGGNNLGGTTGTSSVNLTVGTYGVVYGGGDQAVTNLTNVTISGTAKVLNNVYGGGNQAKVNTNTNVDIGTVSIDGDVYGGGNAGDVEGNTIVVLTGSSILKNVFGGGDAGKVLGDVGLTVTNATISENVFGGGNQASILGNAVVEIDDSSITKSVYGGGNFGAVVGNTDVSVTTVNVGESIYAGGNGTSASVIGNTLLNVDGNTTIGKHIFGGGNAASVGCDSSMTLDDGTSVNCSNPNNSTSEVNIASASVGGNVYGGANTSKLFGVVYLNIGSSAIDSSYNLVSGDINISGTVFGGGEANASGSEEYDFSFISVTKGINIYIDATGYDNFDISGSIFGSGNASSSGGYSYITIKNYGTFSDYKKNISIQRADIVTLDKCAIELSGAKDRTNKFDNELFTISRVDELKLKNGSVLFLDKGANLLKKFSSLVDVAGEEVKASVSIDVDNNTMDRNVNNRVYMYEGKNLNISDSETLSSYGEVDGMTFFGMFTKDRNGNVSTALYSDKYNSGDAVSSSELYYFSSGSYVVGLHEVDHDYYVDGFYSNYANEEGTGIYTDYIIPTPPAASYYRWVIGEDINSIEVKLTASKYSTLGTYELQLLDYYAPNTEIDVLGVNYDDLSSDISLLASDDIPRVARSTEDANSNFGLGMKSGNAGWITIGDTEFLTSDPMVSGTDTYIKDNSSDVPSFVFYLYHSKNLTDTKDLGSVTISLMVVTPTSELSNKIERINIVVKLATALYDGDNYEATINVGSQYKMFANSAVNITNDGTFSAYYSLFSSSDTTIYKDGYYRSLVSSYVLPVNTSITMIDFASGDSPIYYYYVVSESDYTEAYNEYNQEGEASYKLSKFIRMGSTSSGNYYDDSIQNSIYYDSEAKSASEEFIFIVNFGDSGIDTDVLSKSFLLELRNSSDNAVIPVLGIAQEKMVYNLYENKDARVSVTGELSSDSIYVGDSVTLTATTEFVQDKTSNSSVIYDTKYFDEKMGIKISIYDENDNLVNGASLFGVSFTYNGSTYYPRVDGTVRFNIAERVANVAAKIKINTKGSKLASGNYKILIESFGSSDGIYYGLVPSSSTYVDLKVINNIFGLDVSLDEKSVIIDSKTGNTLNGNNFLRFTLGYDSGLEDPVIRISLQRRNYDGIYNMNYDKVDLNDYLASNGFSNSDVEYEYIAVNMPQETNTVTLQMSDNLITGTYRVVFSLYDGNSYIGEVYQYIIIE